jgi:cytochrome c-type biogenesis protein CcmH/NrfG
MMNDTQEETAMRVVKNWFPIVLAILWVAMAALAMVDFANFNAATAPRKAVAKQERPLHSTLSQGRVPRARALPN